MRPRPAMPPGAARDGGRAWIEAIFASRAAANGGVVRRAVRDVEREIGRAALIAEVRRRGWHLVECGDQFVIVCNPGRITVIC